ncbi:mitotic spindle assembly checkpoint protein MAD1 isoform X1 [Physeter macrocephalus]|uniref:Mitotic spindle assembly checkpoint protein MAD1 n=2 Tax=Physeter macrocephalus TaxID=9755 RepID=A0A2Y9SRD7_PHYMC|nr:mitotic spindle assembly checkpoint protein MAD1 isoform X1 [Physeter catodon]XP_028354408.1 mitotic spindle assembly checkpoint protein MAD1 isoform X1 [Physeter catodon]|eukprot:XP_023980773.1 mitotic spindle assembly checkpoint protein MAD1 [Physeter catodon]
MEDLGENTTVLSTLRSLNSFISQRVEGGSGLDVSTSAQGSLQMQYQQSMQLEERAEQIRSRSHLIQVEREKAHMELSHKRARVELERAASASARSYEREADRNQELLTRIRQLQEREAEAEEKVQEQLGRYRLCQQSLDAASKKLREKEDGLAEAGETISVLKGRLSDLQWSVMNQEMQVKRLESERQELKEQLELQHRKWQEANQKVQELQASQEARVDQEQRIKDLEQKLSLQEQDAAVVKNMRSELVRLPTMERELRHLREENACLREMRDTNGLLREELEGLQRRLGRQEKMQETLVDLELEKERLLTKLQSWERLDQTSGLSIRTPEDLSRFIVELQQRELALKDRNSSITSSARGLEKARLQLQEEVRQLSSQLLEERKKREMHEALARRLQKRVLLLTKERDGMRAILGSYDSELTPAEYSPQLTRRMREAEDMVQKVHAHSSEVEAQLSQALEELGGQKQRADMLEMELKMLKSQAGPAEQSFLFSREEVSSLRLKVEELEGERSRLEEEKKVLETQLERLTLQGDYDQSRTKVLHLSLNPAGAARQRLHEERQRLQEECQRLQELVRALEAGGAVPAHLEAAAGMPSSREVAELKKQVESAELKNQRLKEVFQTKIQEFRKVCYTLTGYQVDITTENQYRLTSMYAEHQADCLLFKAAGPSGTKMQLLETEFSRTVQELIELHLLRQDSIPAFLSALTLDLFSRQTVA